MIGRRRQLYGLSLFLGGFLVAVLFGAAAVWADVEAAMFDAALIAEGERLRTISCPTIMTTGESATVYASFSNPTEREVSLPIRARISDGFVTLIREERSDLVLAPGETRRYSVAVTASDAAYDRFVLVRIHQLRSAPHPYRQGTCGIIVLDIPYLSGGHIVTLLLALSLGAMAGGLRLWSSHSRVGPSRTEHLALMLILAALAALAIVTGVIGWWGLGLGVLALTLLFLTGAVGYLLQQH